MLLPVNQINVVPPSSLYLLLSSFLPLLFIFPSSLFLISSSFPLFSFCLLFLCSRCCVSNYNPGADALYNPQHGLCCQSPSGHAPLALHCILVPGSPLVFAPVNRAAKKLKPDVSSPVGFLLFTCLRLPSLPLLALRLPASFPP